MGSTQSRGDGLQEAPRHDPSLSNDVRRPHRSRVPIDPRGLPGRRGSLVSAEWHRRPYFRLHRKARAHDEGGRTRAVRERRRRSKSRRLGGPQGSTRDHPAVDQRLGNNPGSADRREGRGHSGSGGGATFAKVAYGSPRGESIPHRPSANGPVENRGPAPCVGGDRDPGATQLLRRTAIWPRRRQRGAGAAVGAWRGPRAAKWLSAKATDVRPAVPTLQSLRRRAGANLDRFSRETS